MVDTWLPYETLFLWIDSFQTSSRFSRRSTRLASQNTFRNVTIPTFHVPVFAAKNNKNVASRHLQCLFYTHLPLWDTPRPALTVCQIYRPRSPPNGIAIFSYARAQKVITPLAHPLHRGTLLACHRPSRKVFRINCSFFNQCSRSPAPPSSILQIFYRSLFKRIHFFFSSEFRFAEECFELFAGILVKNHSVAI